MTTETEPTAKGSKPAFIAYQIEDMENEKGFFTRVGAMWPHRKGKGFTLLLKAVPLDGRVCLLPPKEKPE